MASLKVACVVLMCMAVVGAPIAQAAITCGQVTSNLAPCIAYLRSGGNPTGACCNGVKTLVSLAKTTADKQTACKCLQSAASSIPGFNPQNGQSLPGKCNVNIPYKISPSTDCNTIKF